MTEMLSVVEEIQRSAAKIPEDKITSLIQLIQTYPRIFVYGTGRSGLMLKTFAMRLMQLGFTSFVVGETTTPSMQKGDLLIVASASGETGSVVQAVEKATAAGITVISLTASEKSRLSAIVQPFLLLNTGTKFAHSDASVQPLGSLFEQMLLVYFDAVVLRMSRDSGGDGEMARRHASLE